MDGLLSDPIFWGAILGLIGVLFGQVVIWKSKGRDSALTEIQAAVTVLRAEYKRLTGEVEKLRSMVEHSEAQTKHSKKQHRLMTEKFSVALSHAASLRIAGLSLFIRLDKAGIPHADLPPVPELIRADMHHEWPEAFSDDKMWDRVD